MKETVALYRAERYDVLELFETIKRGLDELGIRIPGGSRVLLKPNVISQNTPGQCATTHPAVVEAVCMLLKEHDCRITIGDSSAFYEGGYTERGFKKSGMEKIAKKYDARLVAFEKGDIEIFSLPENRALPELLMTSEIRHTDFIINLPKLKTHSFFGMSGAVKNLFGLVPGGTKYEYHFLNGHTREAFGEKLTDIYQTAHPQLTIMDAVMGLEGFGPAATGHPKKTGLLLMSANPFALDMIAGRITGLDPARLESNRAGIRRGLVSDPGSIPWIGDFDELPNIPYRPAKNGKEHTKEEDSFYRLMKVDPVLNRRKCNKCGVCARICPVGAIRMEGFPDIDLAKCLHCYACFYRCPRKAIRLEGSFLNLAARFLRKILRI